MDNLLNRIDWISEWTAKIARWLAVVLILLLSFEVVMRYVFNSPTVWVMQTSMMVGGTLVALGWSYVLQQQAHVRVDVFYGRLSAKHKALVNILGAIFVMFPFVGFLAYKAGAQALYSYKMGEVMSETAWYPPIFPVRAVVFLALALFLLQGIAQFIRDLRTFTGKEDGE